MSKSATPTQEGIAEQTCPNGNAGCPRDNLAVEDGALLCWGCFHDLDHLQRLFL